MVCSIGVYCSDHGFVNGAEAEELREGVARRFVELNEGGQSQ
jgi:hypothetical protein